LREIGAKEPAARSARPEQFVDTTILKELDSSVYRQALQVCCGGRAAPRTEPAFRRAKGNVQVADAKTKAVATKKVAGSQASSSNTRARPQCRPKAAQNTPLRGHPQQDCRAALRQRRQVGKSLRIESRYSQESQLHLRWPEAKHSG
jgi:5-methylcytosine-specific restriction endonuclease McrA